MDDMLSIEQRHGVGIAAIMARRHVGTAAVETALGMALPTGPQATTCGAMTIAGYGPSTWLAFEEDASADLAGRLREKLSGLASVSDQSSGYSIFRLAGAKARTLLQRGAAIDFHPDTFSPGSIATTVIAHIGVVIRQVDATPTYDVAMFRSFTGRFRRWLDQSVAAL